MKRPGWPIPFLIIFSLCVAFYQSVKADDTFHPNVQPTLNIPRSSGAIKIDGILDESAWNSAARASNFSEYQPGDMTRPPVNTVALITYDEENLYVAFIAYDDPKTIRASIRNRDDIWQDENVGFILDTYGDAAWAYEIFANPYGIQGDVRWNNGNGEDTGFDIIFKSAGVVTDSGFQVEFAIPFKSLRFPNKPAQTWKATFWRNHPRAVRGQYSWAAIPKDSPCFPCAFGIWTGIENVKPGRDVALLPSVTGFQSAEIRDSDDPHSGLKYNKIDGRLSLGARYSLSSSSTIEAAWKPDFSQVESDPAQIDINSTYALFYSERRPFFQEGAELFYTPFTTVYTRSINDPLVAAKLVGRSSHTSFAYLGGRDLHSPIILPFEESGEFLMAGKSATNIFRVKHAFMEDAYIGGLFTDRRFDEGGSGSLGGIDGRIRVLKRYTFRYQALVSHTDEMNDSTLSADISQGTFDFGRHTAAFDGESFFGQAYSANLSRDAKYWNFNINYYEKSPTFRADNGFESGNGTRQIEVWSGRTFYFEKSWITQVTPNFDFAHIRNFHGVHKDLWFMPDISAQLVGQTSLELQYLWSAERFHNILFKGIRRFSLNINSNFSDPVTLGIYTRYGHLIARNLDTPVLGRGGDFDIWGTFKPTSKFIMSYEIDYSSLNYPDGGNIFSGYILRTKFNYQFTRELLARLVLQYDDFDRNFRVEPLISYKLNPFTIFYIGSAHAFDKYDGADGLIATSEQYFLKLQYLLGL